MINQLDVGARRPVDRGAQLAAARIAQVHDKRLLSADLAALEAFALGAHEVRLRSPARKKADGNAERRA